MPSGMRATGRCPHCDFNQIRVERFVPLSDWKGMIDVTPPGYPPVWHPQSLLAYICGSCGFVELYLAPQETQGPP